MQVNDVVAKRDQQLQCCQRIPRIEDSIGIGLSMAGQVTHLTFDPAVAKHLTKRNNVRLDAAVWRGKWTDDQNSHAQNNSIICGLRVFADSSIRRHAIVARAPSRADTFGAPPLLTALMKSSI